MLRVTATHLVQEVSDQFGFTAIDPRTTGPRDVLFCPSAVAFRIRMEQIAELKRNEPSNYENDHRNLLFPFMSVYRTRVMYARDRSNATAAFKGAKYERDDDLDIYKKYKMVPCDMSFELHYYSDKVDEGEGAIEDYLRWAAPANQLSFEDNSGVTFRLPIIFENPVTTDDPELGRQYDIGVIYHSVYGVTVRGWVTEDPGQEIKTILSIHFDVYYYRNSDTSTAKLLETKEIS
jgi:hypothetical protein